MHFRTATPLLAVALAVPGQRATAQVARLGAHYGVNLTEGHWEHERLGVQGEVVRVPLRRPRLPAGNAG